MRNVSNSSSDQCSKGNRLEPRLRKLRQAIIRCRDLFELDEIVFCDGGGDSLILQHGDANSQSETVDPYDGGDAEVLRAIHGLPFCSMAILSVGLDIKKEAFLKNLNALQARGAYYGKMNPCTCRYEDIPLLLQILEEESIETPQDHLEMMEFSQRTESEFALTERAYVVPRILSWSRAKGGLKRGIGKYLKIAGDVLVWKDEHVQDSDRTMSHTAVTTFHALAGRIGERYRTYVSWEPVDLESGERGVYIDEFLQWIFFVNPTEVENLKSIYNR